MTGSKVPLSLSRMCCSPEEAKVVLPQSPAKSKIAQGGGEMAAGTSAKGMDWMDLMCSWVWWLQGGEEPEMALQKIPVPR